MTLTCPILFMGPSAITTPADGNAIVRPASVEGKAYIEAAVRGDLTEAAKIGMQRTLERFPGLQFSTETPDGPKLPAMAVSSGSCLEPYVNDGDIVIAAADEPSEGGLVGLHIKGHPPDFKQLKVLYKILYRGNNFIATFGENQPDKIYAVLTTNPLSLILIADHDIDYWRRVSWIQKNDGTTWQVDKFPLSNELIKTIELAFSQPSI